jgi:hypothetical protein
MRRKNGKERTNRIVLQKAQRPTRPRPHHGLVVARQRHGDDAHGDGAGFRCDPPGKGVTLVWLFADIDFVAWRIGVVVVVVEKREFGGGGSPERRRLSDGGGARVDWRGWKWGTYVFWPWECEWRLGLWWVSGFLDRSG